MYKEMELLMNGFITTDGNFGNQAGRTYSANGKERTVASARRNVARAYAPASNNTVHKVLIIMRMHCLTGLEGFLLL